MKYILKLLMMFIAYSTFAQNSNNQQKRTITLQNGDEDITIIKSSEKNVIQLSATDDSNRNNMLDLSNHEANHRSTKKKGLIRTDLLNQYGENYTVEESSRNHARDLEDESEETSGA